MTIINQLIEFFFVSSYTLSSFLLLNLQLPWFSVSVAGLWALSLLTLVSIHLCSASLTPQSTHAQSVYILNCGPNNLLIYLVFWFSHVHVLFPRITCFSLFVSLSLPACRFLLLYLYHCCNKKTHSATLFLCMALCLPITNVEDVNCV